MDSPEAPIDAVLGQGTLPAELDRLNWSAVLWSALWAAVYGIWPWFWGLIALRTAGGVFFVLFNRSAVADSPSIVIPVVLAWGLANWSLNAVFGWKANHLLWRRRQAATGTVPTTTVATYLQTQRKWAFIGLAFLIFSYIPGSMRDGAITLSAGVGLGVALGSLACIWALERWQARGRQS